MRAEELINRATGGTWQVLADKAGCAKSSVCHWRKGEASAALKETIDKAVEQWIADERAAEEDGIWE